MNEEVPNIVPSYTLHRIVQPVKRPLCPPFFHWVFAGYGWGTGEKRALSCALSECVERDLWDSLSCSGIGVRLFIDRGLLGYGIMLFHPGSPSPHLHYPHAPTSILRSIYRSIHLTPHPPPVAARRRSIEHCITPCYSEAVWWLGYLYCGRDTGPEGRKLYKLGLLA